MKEVYAMKITFEEGSTQVINPSEKFDGDYATLAREIAKGSKYSYEVLKGNERRNKR